MLHAIGCRIRFALLLGLFLAPVVANCWFQRVQAQLEADIFTSPLPPPRFAIASGPNTDNQVPDTGMQPISSSTDTQIQ